MIRLLRKFLSLPPYKQWLLVKASLVLLGIHFGLRLFRFHYIYRIINSFRHTPLPGDPANGKGMGPIIWAVNRAGFYLLGSNSCLRRALAGQFFLLREGFPATLRIGVMKQSDGSLLAHAWIEKDGTILIGGSAERLDLFQPLADLDQVIFQEHTGPPQ